VTIVVGGVVPVDTVPEAVEKTVEPN